MKRVVRFFLFFLSTTLFIMSASVCVCVVRVHADDTPTYYSLGNGCVEIANYNNRYYNVYIKNNSSEIRSVILKQPENTSGNLYLVSANTFEEFVNNNASAGCDPTWNAGFTLVSITSTGYAVARTGFSFTRFPNCIIPVIETNDISESSAVYYTFGEGAVDPVDPIVWGLVDVKGYQTNVAGQGQASINNVDVISWDSAIDTLGNDITTGNVRIRFLPGEYRAETKNSLIQKTYNDFILDVVHATDGNVFPVTDGSASFRWSDVIHTLNLPFLSIYSLINENDAWIKRGWIYEIRLEIDDYVGEWQPIYASTSSGVENDMTIVNTTVISQDTITAIQNINNINGTTNIWIINGQPVDPNPEQSPPESDDEKPWWVYLLEMINNTLGIQNQYINEGTDESQDVVNSFEGDHNNLNVTVNDYDDIENTVVNDMNDNIDNLAIESDLIKNNSFINSARWVAEQYTTLTTNNPIGSILKFSLVLGFVMIFLGRFR